MATERAVDVSKKIDSKFKAGVSGNPLGRPKQTEEIKMAKVRDALDKNIVAIFYKVLYSALAGDIQAAGLIFEIYGLSNRILDVKPDLNAK